MSNDFEWKRFLAGEVEALSVDVRRARRRARCERRRKIVDALVGAAVIICVVLAGTAPWTPTV
jgi:hypothetical protein